MYSTLPFTILSWFSPPDWKSYKATNRFGSSSVWLDNRFSLDIHFVPSTSIGASGRGRLNIASERKQNNVINSNIQFILMETFFKRFNEIYYQSLLL